MYTSRLQPLSCFLQSLLRPIAIEHFRRKGDVITEITERIQIFKNVRKLCLSHCVSVIQSRLTRDALYTLVKAR